jgi:hypothetical protein
MTWNIRITSGLLQIKFSPLFSTSSRFKYSRPHIASHREETTYTVSDRHKTETSEMAGENLQRVMSSSGITAARQM